MADLFTVDTATTSASSTNLTVDDVGGLGPGSGPSLDTGDLRRKFNFGDRVSELSLASDPFFRFLSKVSKKPTDDPAFKWAEKRPSWNKRYGYVCAYVNQSGVTVTNNAILHATNDGGEGASVAVGDTLNLWMASDYTNSGNKQNIYGKTSNHVAVGASGTQPLFFLPGQIIKVPTQAADKSAVSEWGKGYLVARISAVDTNRCEGLFLISIKYPY